jgi:hypothetical protein
VQSEEITVEAHGDEDKMEGSPKYCVLLSNAAVQDAGGLQEVIIKKVDFRSRIETIQLLHTDCALWLCSVAG